MSLDEFSVLIAWSGPEDKPFYRALLVSAALSAHIDHKPFWGYAIISKQELDQLVDVLQTQGCAASPGPYSGVGAEYYVEIRRANQVSSYALGFDSQTHALLTQLADALEPEHRQPVAQILTRLSSALA